MLGNEEDFTACLGLEIEGVDDNLTELDTGSFRAMIERQRRSSRTSRSSPPPFAPSRSATVNDWSAIAWSRDHGFAEATPRPGLEILDRVGGGDSFASGLIYGLIEARRPPHGSRIRRRPRRARDDDPRRHLDRHPRGGRVTRRRRQRTHQPLMAGCARG